MHQNAPSDVRRQQHRLYVFPRFMGETQLNLVRLDLLLGRKPSPCLTYALPLTATERDHLEPRF
jgi:hypothetical protein